MPIHLSHWLEGVFNLNGIKRLLKKIPKPLEAAMHIGITVVEAMKKFVESPVADVITMLIPGDLDDKIKEKLREALPKIVIELQLVKATSELTDPNEILLSAMTTLRQIAGDYRSDFLDALAVQITLLAADGDYSWDDVKYTLKWVYDHKYKTIA